MYPSFGAERTSKDRFSIPCRPPNHISTLLTTASSAKNAIKLAAIFSTRPTASDAPAKAASIALRCSLQEKEVNCNRPDFFRNQHPRTTLFDCHPDLRF